jgi:hypothetical protein
LPEDIYCRTQNPDMGKFWRILLLKICVYFVSIWYILCPFGILYDHLVYFVVIWFVPSHILVRWTINIWQPWSQYVLKNKERNAVQMKLTILIKNHFAKKVVHQLFSSNTFYENIHINAFELTKQQHCTR